MTDRTVQQSGGFFQSGHGSSVQIHGGQFIQHNHAQNTHSCSDATDAFLHLQAHVAVSAFDSQDYVDAPKCHPNTRRAVLDEIINWIILTVTRVQWILWLNGAAGAGKSAIARSIVDFCIERNIPIARFFFFRTDSTRNHLKPLVATLVHQLLQSIPSLEPIIIPRIKSDPLIFTKSLETQFKTLVFGPLHELKRLYIHLHTLVLLFDGVDECDNKEDQQSLIHIVAKFVHSGSFPVAVFFASRTEDQITTAFRAPKISNITLRLPLDDHYLPDNDISLFLSDSFTEIKSTHPFGQFLDSTWPAVSDIQKIVAKSSGQFIYASTVIKFCAMLGHHPQKQLEIVHGLRPCGMLTPFAQLNALYQHIFAQVQNIEDTLLVLAWTILTPLADLKYCTEFCGMETYEVHILLDPFQSVIDCTSSSKIKFLHASLPDFLLDKERSQEHYISHSTWSTCLSVMAHNFVMSNGDQDFIPWDLYLNEAEVTSDLQDCVLAFNPENITSTWNLALYLSYVKKLDFGDGPGGAIYQQKLNAFVCYATKQDPEHFHGDFTQWGHDISDILQQIEKESAPMMPDAEAFKEHDQNQPDLLDAADEETHQNMVTSKGQQESTDCTVPNMVQQEIRTNSMRTPKIFRAPWKSKNHETVVQEAGVHGAEEGTMIIWLGLLGMLVTIVIIICLATFVNTN